MCDCSTYAPRPGFRSEIAICKHWKQSGGKCPFGDKCVFAHGEDDLRSAPGRPGGGGGGGPMGGGAPPPPPGRGLPPPPGPGGGGPPLMGGGGPGGPMMHRGGPGGGPGGPGGVVDIAELVQVRDPRLSVDAVARKDRSRPLHHSSVTVASPPGDPRLGKTWRVRISRGA